MIIFFLFQIMPKILLIFIIAFIGVSTGEECVSQYSHYSSILSIKILLVAYILK
jgi:hypothetical protein